MSTDGVNLKNKVCTSSHAAQEDAMFFFSPQRQQAPPRGQIQDIRRRSPAHLYR